MKVSDFRFELPEQLIAQYPLPDRTASRLLCLERDSGRWHDRRFADLVDMLRPGDLLVFNNTRVLPARLPARKHSGGRVEIMLERMLGQGEAIVQLRANRRPAKDSELLVEGHARLRVLGREGEVSRLAGVSVPDGVQLPLCAARKRHRPYTTRANKR